MADGTAAGSYEDWHRLRGNEAGDGAGLRCMFKTMEVLSGDPQSPALEDRVARHPPADAADLGRHGRGVRVRRPLRPASATRNVEHWNLPDATHTAAIRQEAKPYEARVTAFFERELR